MTDRTVSSLPPRSRAASMANAPRRAGRRRLLRRDERGAAIVEFVFVVPIFLFITFGFITYGLVLAEKQKVTNTAADAARAAVGAPLGTEVAAAKARITNVLGAPGTKYTLGPDTAGGGQPQVAACPPPETSHNCITVRITYNYKDHPIIPKVNLPGLSLFTPDTISTTATAQVS